MTDPINLFIDTVAASGSDLKVPINIIANDKINRHPLADDKGSKTSFCYRLKIDGNGFAFGWFKNQKEGTTHNYHSKSDKQLSAAEKLEYKRALEASRKSRDRDIKIAQETAAKTVNFIWGKSKSAGITSYLADKKCELIKARIYKDRIIIVPIYIGGKITSAQFIQDDGKKRFKSGGQCVGGYCPLANTSEDLSEIIICEGYATGVSLRTVTGKPVIIAFSCDNLLPVAKKIRDKYPQSKIIIAADNDAFTTRPDGTAWNPGVEKAKEIFGKIVNCAITWPEFKDNDAKKYTDFNDAYRFIGTDYVEQRISTAGDHGMPVLSGDSASGILSSGSQGGVITKDNWKHFVHKDKDENKIKKNSLHNLYLFMRFHEEFAGLFAYNEFHHNITMMRCPPWENEAKFDPKPLDDICISHVTADLEKYGFTTPDTGKVFKAIEMTAYTNKFHPAQDYFNSLVWDGKPRLKNWLTYYLGCESDAPEYLEFIGKKWLTAAVTRIFRPGCKFDHVLVLEGGQGAAKSTAFKTLATFGKDRPIEYFSDAIKISDIQNKDTVMKIQGSIIVELAELSGFSKKDDEEIKSWITVQQDIARLPYARTVSVFKRQFILGATTNRYDYLKDPTGNRRYWPAEAGAKLDIKALEQDKEQLWAEAVVEYKSGLYLGPTAEEEKLANHERDKRLSQDPWTEIVMEKIKESRHDKFRVSEILDDMGLHLRDKDQRAASRVAAIMQINGFTNKTSWDSQTQKSVRFWTKAGVEISESAEELPY